MNSLKLLNRDSNIELLRILCICGVIILHYSNTQIGKALLYVDHESINYYVLMFLINISICGVNLFMLISGYYLSNNFKVILVKPIKLLFAVISFKFVIYCIHVFLSKETLGIVSIFNALLPTNYFIILYITVYLISPYINKIFLYSEYKVSRRFILILFMIFSVYPTIVDVLGRLGFNIWGLSSIGMYGSQYGYSFVNFLLIYCLGVFCNKLDFEKINYKKLIILLVVCNVVLNSWSYLDSNTAWEYCNPVLILQTIIIFILFKKIKIQKSKKINLLGDAAFTVFLLHFYFFNKLNIHYFVNSNILFFLMHIFSSCLIIYLICFFVHLCYKKIEAIIFNLTLFKSSILNKDITLVNNE